MIWICTSSTLLLEDNSYTRLIIKISSKDIFKQIIFNIIYIVETWLLGEWQKAADDFSHGLRLQPDDPLAHKRRADALGKLGMKEKAIADYQYAVQLQARIKFLKSIHSK